MTWKEKRRARMLFKRLKIGLTTFDELNEDDVKLLRRYYPFLFR